jgi:succinoglycan biosynthesis protein ExoO
MKPQARVSVIVPAHNCERWIDGSLRSALAQSLDDLEVIVVDDSSTDGTAQRLAALAADDPRVRVLRPTRRMGAAGARNLALDAARGEWIALLDADDRIHPSRLARMIEAADRSNVDIVADNLNKVAEDGTPLGRIWPAITADMLIDAETFVLGNRWGAADRPGLGFAKPVFRHALVESPRMRYRENLRIGEDYHFLLALLLGGSRMLLLAEAMYDYTIRATSASHSLREQDLQVLLRAGNEIRQASPSPSVRAALAQQLRTLEDLIAYFGFAAAVKRGKILRAVGTLARRPGAVHLVARNGWQWMSRRARGA